MAILNIVKYPDELLHKKSEDVKDFDEKLKDFVSDMFETMKEFGGIGLAAVQVGILKKVIVYLINFLLRLKINNLITWYILQKKLKTHIIIVIILFRIGVCLHMMKLRMLWLQ